MISRCHKTQRRIANWLALGEAEQAGVRKHAEECPACRDELERTLRALEPLAAARDAYRELRYEGRRPAFDAPRAAKKQGWGWQIARPLPVVLATAVLSLSMVLYLTSEPGSMRPDSTLDRPLPRPVTGADPGKTAKEAADEPTEPPTELADGASPDPGQPSRADASDASEVPSEARSEPRNAAESVVPPTPRPFSPSDSLGAIRRRARSLERPALPPRPTGFSFRIPGRPPTPNRPGADGTP